MKIKTDKDIVIVKGILTIKTVPKDREAKVCIDSRFYNNGDKILKADVSSENWKVLRKWKLIS